ncbi:SusC/RagA family TonB-linked outer membrane protein [Niabella ginsengisoli]|uniref:SusC/RagA family TonB-linked outer membrane protein n=1 Tax=Niabella ginsengisoli TaxID=522298 RepID=A0ABS9SEN4_9BACT|nr:SusC/RagA family TonB-linked outer membrane protein [Niabella ginsengisoli]MCH5596819.1 SusC/RagA family TonB-linked outer membrane protein [Niabella ginsengisoli]
MFYCLLPITGWGQTKTISGSVSGQNGPLQGVTVAVIETQTATLTDADGKFSITAQAGQSLEFTYIGYEKQTVTISTETNINVTLTPGTGTLESEVVVTALGIKKERKALGYSVSDLGAQELMKNKNTNVVNSLVGKVPGVNVTQFSGAAGAGASITIRGGNSTSDGRQNQPLFVIDGIIYDNSTTVTGNTGTDGLSRSNTSYSNRIMDINPEDIENLSVLKGAAAAALYGSRAADGVIIITTKKGAEGKVNVNVNSKIITSWANKIPEAQTQFGNGTYASNGVFNDITYRSWGKEITSADTVYNNIQDFFKNGLIYDNNVNVSGGTKNGSFYLSASNYNQTGIVPETDYNKTTFRFNGVQKYGRLTLDANAAYSVADNDRTLTTGGLYAGGGNGTMGAIYSWPQTFDIKRYRNPDGTQYRRFDGTIDLVDDIDNPYWIINMDKLTSQTKRFTGGLNASFKIAEWWDVIARLGYDQYATNDYTYIAPGSAVIPLYQNGRLSKSLYDYTFITTTAMSNFHKTVGDFDLRLLLGTTSENTEIKSQNQWGYNFVTAGTIAFSNFAPENQFFRDRITQKRLVGGYGEFGVSYKDIAFITATGRNDWSSTLPVENRSYFYPSLSGSFVFTELLPKNNILSFGKVRASWAQVGKDANAYATLTYVNNPITIGSFTGIGNQYTSGNPFLKPEIQKSWEVGGELRFLKGRIGLDYTYYHSQTENQIAQPRLSNASGYILTAINSGSVINKGMEIALTGKPVVQRDFGWDVMLNFSYNKGRLGEFLPGVAYFYPTDAQFGTVKAASIPNGGFFLGMTGTTYLRETDANNQEIANGRYQVDPTTGLYKLNNNNPIVGNREPDFIGGFNNTLRYKDLTLSFLIDVRKGGDVYNGTEYSMILNGLSERTLLNNRESVTVNGVNSQTGAEFSQTYNADESYVINGTTYSGNYMIQQYWANYAANSMNLITSVNWLKLRSLSLTYDFTDMLKSTKVIKGISATAIGTNLLTLTNYEGMDPEVSAAGGTGGSGSTGIDYLGVPAVASFTFGINLSF